MGEIADQLIEDSLCDIEDHIQSHADMLFALAKRQKNACDICGARLRTAEGVAQHKRDKHETHSE